MIDYSKLKKLDEYAKSLGLTIYRVKYGYEIDNQYYTNDVTCLNIEPERLKNEPHLKGLASAL